MVIALLGNGHLLIEGVPGLAKTTAVATLARALDTGFQRLQFTPDLLPADIIGGQVYRPQTQEFVVNKGPIFSNLILADEINRAPAKVQAALLEAMQERQVSIGHETFRLAEPFIVMATQNPIEQEGTYPLPEAQMDRFMMKVHVDYPTRDEELAILDRMSSINATFDVKPVVNPAEIAAARRLIDRIHMEDSIRQYIVDLVMATRRPADFGLDLGDAIEAGASPRGTLNLAIASRVRAFLAGRNYVVPQDVKDIAPDVLRHRLILGYEAEAMDITADSLIEKILKTVRVP
jgi:MoxR-like ATPase